jgi:tetratricopeptide (TPR) repeat protein
MSEMIRAAIVRVRRDSNQQVVGVGFLVDAGKKTILTCAHVINAAIEDSENQVKPRSLISLDFPFLDPDKRLDARVTHFFPKKRDNTDDIALLEILDDLPAGASAVTLTTSDSYNGHEFGAYGFPYGFEDDGQYVEGRLQEFLANKRLQAVGATNLGHFVEEGFSGGPVYDKDLGVVVGMMMAIADEREKRVAYICPSKLIKQFLQGSNTKAPPSATLQSLPPSTTTQHSAISARTDGAFVFISYSHSDGQDIARLIHDVLEKNGCRVWIDYKDLAHAPGIDWDMEIDQAIEDCQTVIAVVTPLAVKSTEVRSEWRLALDEKKAIVPAIRQPVRIPRHFRLFQWIDLSEGVDFQTELTKLINKLGCSNGNGGIDDFSFTPPPTDHVSEGTSDESKIIHIDEAREYAMTLLRRREYTRLIAWSDELGETLKADSEILALRAVAQDALGNVKAALEEYAKAIGLTPDNANLYVQRAELNVDVGNIREAFEDFERALRLNPELKDVIDTETAAVVVLVRHADQLPMPLFDEIEGRDDLVATATSHLESGQGILLYGMGGIGKTALSTVIAKRHLSEDRSVLWVNVGSARLETLLNAIGQEIERELDKEKQFNQAETTTQKSEYIAEWLRKEQPLLVLDDAWNPAETKQLLEAVLLAKCPVIVTTRRDDFEDMDGLIKFDLPKLSSDASVKLYQTISDASDDEQAIESLCQKLEYHPLAIRLAALKAKQGNRTATQMLSEIEAQPAQNSIRAIFDVVIDDVDNHAADAFHVIGALPVTRVTEHFVAIVLDEEDTDVGILLRDLADRGLINPTTTPDNEPFYAVHDLTYAYAHDLLVEQNRVDDLEHRVVQAACRYVESFSGNTPDDFRKLTVEKPTLIASISRARGYQDHDSIYALVDGLITFLDYQGYSIDHLNILEIALESADKQADKRKQARYWNESANISIKLGRYTEAIGFLEQALSVTREFGDRRSEGSIIGNLANAYTALGEFDRAIEYYEQALPLIREIGDRASEATIFNNLGSVWDSHGDKRKALTFYEQALPIRRAVGDRRGEATTLSNIGAMWDDLGDKQKALDYYEQALVISREIGDRRGEAVSLTNIGVAWDDLGEYRKALDYYEQALPLVRSMNDRRSEAVTLNNIGEVYRQLGEQRKSLDYYEQALPIFHAMGDVRNEATVLSNIGEVNWRLGQVDEALRHYENALMLFRAEGAQLGEANALKSMGDLASRLGQVDEALRHYENALMLFRAEGAQLGEANALKSMGDLASRLGQVDEALRHYENALMLFRAEGAQLGEANTLKGVADITRRLGQVNEAQSRYKSALTLYRAERDRLGEANTLQSLADLATRLGSIDEARAHYESALVLYRAERDRLGEANTLQSLADLATRLGSIDEARAHHESALVLYRAERAQLGEANTLQSLGSLAINSAQFDQAQFYFENALALYRSERDQLGEANTLKSIADLAVRRDQLHEAQVHYSEALKLFQIERARLGEANVLFSLAGVSLRKEKINEAFELFSRSLDLYESEQDATGKMNVIIGLARVYIQQKDYDKAKSNYESAFAIAETIGFSNHPIVESWRKEYRQLTDSVRNSLIGSEHEARTLAEQLVSWINTSDWNASQQYITENSESLLTPGAVSVLEMLIAANEDHEVLKLHFALLKSTIENGIPVTYDALRQRASKDTEEQVIGSLTERKNIQQTSSVSGEIQGGNINIGGQQSFSGNITIGDESQNKDAEEDE